MTQERVYAGIDIGATNIKYGLVDTKGKVLFKEQRPTLADKGREPLLHLVANIGEQLMLHAAEEDYDIPWLGVASPGAIDATGTVIGMAPNIKVTAYTLMVIGTRPIMQKNGRWRRLQQT